LPAKPRERDLMTQSDFCADLCTTDVGRISHRGDLTDRSQTGGTARMDSLRSLASIVGVETGGV